MFGPSSLPIPSDLGGFLDFCILEVRNVREGAMTPVPANAQLVGRAIWK